MWLLLTIFSFVNTFLFTRYDAIVLLSCEGDMKQRCANYTLWVFRNLRSGKETGSSRVYSKVAHHAHIFVLQVVAMVEIKTGVVAKAPQDLNAFARHD